MTSKNAPPQDQGDFPLLLLGWYQQEGRSLPWRESKNPYHIWVSEIMLQQTRVVAVIEYYHRFLAELPDIPSLALCPEDRLMKLWQGLGYYNRARNLQKGAQQIMERHGGEFPQEYQAIHDLAGVGDYTAGAVASIAFGLPYPAVDGNFFRVISRFTADETDISTPVMKKRVTEWVAERMPLAYPGDFNQAIMELGATICLPNGAPKCEVCPVSALCASQKEELWRKIPVKAAKKPRRLEERRVYLLYQGERLLLRRRPEKGLLAGLWEFPHTMGEESLPFSVEEEGLSHFSRGKHIFSHIEWRMEGVTGTLSLSTLPEGYALVTLQELEEKYPVPSAFSWILDWLKRGDFF